MRFFSICWGSSVAVAACDGGVTATGALACGDCTSVYDCIISAGVFVAELEVVSLLLLVVLKFRLVYVADVVAAVVLEVSVVATYAPLCIWSSRARSADRFRRNSISAT